MIDILTVLDRGLALIEEYDSVDAWRTAEFGGTDTFAQIVNASLHGLDQGRDIVTILDSAVSMGIVLERLRAEGRV